MKGVRYYGERILKAKVLTPLSGLIAITFLTCLYLNCGQAGTSNNTVSHVSNGNTRNLPFFFQTAWNMGSQAYYGNAISHSWGSNPNARAPYNQTGSNFFIFIGPVFYVQNACNTSHISFYATNVDSLGSHYICNGGTNPRASCSLVNGMAVSSNPSACMGGGTCSSPIPNTYDLGLYCVGGGDCAYGQLYVETGPLDVPHFFRSCSLYSPPCYINSGQNHAYQVDLDFKNGLTTLPSGDYGIGMASNCDDGTGRGNGWCGLGLGEGGPNGYNGSGGSRVTKNGPELMGFKYFTGMYGAHTGCLIYDPSHDNTIGLPPTLTAYDSGSCTAVNSGRVVAKVESQAPHIVNYVIW
jgi:hypothetical protein